MRHWACVGMSCVTVTGQRSGNELGSTDLRRAPYSVLHVLCSMHDVPRSALQAPACLRIVLDQGSERPNQPFLLAMLVRYLFTFDSCVAVVH